MTENRETRKGIGSEVRFLLTHSSIYGLGTVISRLVAFILLPLYTRYLTPADYGILETIDISSGIIGIIVTISIARAMSRFYYESNEEEERGKVVSSTYATYLVLAVLFVPILYVSSDPLSRLLFKTGEYGFYFKVSFAALVLGGLVDTGMMYLRLVKKPVIFISLTTTRLILLISFNILFIVYFRLGILGILYSSLIVRALFSLVMTTAILLRTGMRISVPISLDLLKYGLPMIPSSLGNTVVKQSDKYFVLYLLTMSDLGIYSLALKLGNAVHSLMTIPFNMAYIPRRFEIMKRDDAKQVYVRIFTYYIFLMGFVGLAISVLIPEILVVMVTPRFYAAANLIPLVVASMIIFGCHYHFDFGILYSKKTKYLAYINVSSAVIHLLLNLILISRFGLLGAVWASILALGLQAGFLYKVSDRQLPIRYEFRRISMYLGTAVAVYLLSKGIPAQNIFVSLVLKCVLLAVFVITVVVLGIITPEETARIKKIYTEKVQTRIPWRTSPGGISQEP